MRIRSFLYRRLAKFVTCELSLQGGSRLSLESKYELASFNDVFCHPFYWQVFRLLERPPNLIVDCGAHCGHFTILVDVCLRSRFTSHEAEYLLIEPNPYLLRTIRKNLAEASMSERCDVRQGLVGSKEGSATLWINKKNYLTASTNRLEGGSPHAVDYINLSTVVGEREIDLMKVDIEGGEFEFVRVNLDLMAKVNLIFMELHGPPNQLHDELIQGLRSVDLHLAYEPLEANGHRLAVFQRLRPQAGHQSADVAGLRTGVMTHA